MNEKDTYRHLKKGEVLYKKGDAADLVYIILKGEIEVAQQTRPVTYNEGEVVGMFDALLRGTYSKTATATGKAQVRLGSVEDEFKAIVGAPPHRLVHAFLLATDNEKPGYWS